VRENLTGVLGLFSEFANKREIERRLSVEIGAAIVEIPAGPRVKSAEA